MLRGGRPRPFRYCRSCHPRRNLFTASRKAHLGKPRAAKPRVRASSRSPSSPKVMEISRWGVGGSWDVEVEEQAVAVGSSHRRYCDTRPGGFGRDLDGDGAVISSRMGSSHTAMPSLPLDRKTAICWC